MKIKFVLSLLLAAIALAQSPGTFSATGPMTTPRAGHTATLLTSGKVLITGGSVESGQRTALAEIAEIYDPDRGIFTPTGEMRTPRFYHTATLLPDGRVLIAGGSLSGGLLIRSNTAEIYDPSTGTFAATGNMLGSNACHEATLLGNGKVLIAGGLEVGHILTNAELYDSTTGKFAATGRYVKDTFDFNDCQGVTTSLLPDGRVLVVWQDGGAELYDPDTGSFTTTGNPIPGGGVDGQPSATLLLSGKVLVAGGANFGGYPTIAGLYNLSTGTFAATGNMTIGRYRGSATLLSDGTVLLAGSHRYGGESVLSSAELYDPVAGAFTLTGTMTIPRAIHTGTLLNNGRVLIAGGSTFGAPTTVADLYSPGVLVPAPQLFSASGDGRGQGAIWRASTGEIAMPGNPTVAGEILSMYTTSLAEGGLLPPQVSIGGRLADILYFGAAPGYPGYNQVNFRVPGGVIPGPVVPVRLTYISRPSNEVTIGVR